MKSRNTQKSAEPFFRPGAETAMLVMTPNFGAPCRQAKKAQNGKWIANSPRLYGMMGMKKLHPRPSAR
jgi:hypothetical protein